MEEELKSLIKVLVIAIMSISYCYYLPPKIKSGIPRFLSVLPIVALFLVLPLFYSSVHLSFITAFSLTWLTNFKLILFSFDKGPLIPIPKNLLWFLFFTCFPIKAQQNPKPNTHLPKLVFAIKVAIFGVLLHLYGYKQSMPPILLMGLYFVHLYLEIEIIFTLLKVFISISLGCELEPQSNKPYLATSLQDFWGRRWNIMVPAILRPAVYTPMRRVSERRMSSSWALFPGILATFIVSGLVHDLLFFYLTREMPTGKVTLFFVLQGVCIAAELAVKKKTTVMQRWRLSPTVSRILTVGFVFVTGFWLMTPQLTRSGVMEKYTNEALYCVDFVKHKLLWLVGDIYN
ncbi:PREDICTED: probable long-chain-alcohol O-fatty-acyltransferase 5 [Camelina sativa]|uniref:Probable long-chain-alcohol O-fatty-acyltransferase 5 n=1 Tax=Camelina sativa TaxID=90675 RepID=A0ABM0W806_CAMSA|nr:PREDICTED: probable long-chain-alcohol O-fatty-acyltransferase 5 [Camelina sativa]